MTLSPTRTGDLGQRFVVQTRGWPLPIDDWQDNAYTDTVETAQRIVKSLTHNPSVTDIQVIDRQLQLPLIPPPVWYLSFAGEGGFLGGCFITAVDYASAIRRAHTLKINPGGSVLGGPVFLHMLPQEEQDRVMGSLDRLMSVKDMEELGFGAVRAPSNLPGATETEQ